MRRDRLSVRIDRRRFLRNAGLGSAALATLPVLGQAAVPAWADGEANQIEFTFASNSRATIAGETSVVVMAGDGKFNPSQVEGGGSFNHVRLVDGIPKPLAAAGTWKAKRLVSWNSIGTYGVFAAGILRLDVELIREIPSPLVVPAALEVACNLPSAALLTGEDEGFTLTVAGVSFEPFRVGITLFSTAIDERD